MNRPNGSSRRIVRGIVTLGMWWCQACFSPFDPTSPRGASLRFDATADSSGTLRLRASLDPGRASGRHLRGISSPLLVRGALFPLITATPSGLDWRTVDGTLADAPAYGTEPLTVTVPRVEGLEAPVTELSFATVGTASGDSLIVAPDGSVTIVIVTAVASSPILSQRWSLEMIGATPISVGGSGAPPGRLTIPGSLVPAPHASGTRYALLNYYERCGVVPGIGQNLGRDAYSVEGTWTQRIKLRVRRP